MKRFVLLLLRYRPLLLLLLAAWVLAGYVAYVKLDIEAYPDPSPPLVEVITQNPSWSAEEIEQQITVPIETILNGTPRLTDIRSISMFGLSDVKLYFDFSSDYFVDRQEVLNRLQGITLPNNLQPQLSPWSPVGEIYRFKIDGPTYSLNEQKATADWLVRREMKQVPGIIDVTTFGGTTRQYQVEVDPRKLLQYNIKLSDVVQAVSNSNANVGGGYISLGSQDVNVRGIGLLHSLDDMRNIVVAEHNGAPVFLRDLADVKEGYQQRLGKVGVDKEKDTVEGIVLLQRGEESIPALKGLHEKVRELNNGLLPKGMKLRTLYDRTDLINLTTHTVGHVVTVGLILVTLLLLVFLGDLRISLITALTIPVSILFAFGLMVLTGRSANLISIGAIDFGILVDASVVVLEHIYRALQNRDPDQPVFETIASATVNSARAVMFSTLIIVVAFIPLFTMSGVPGKIFSPMSVTYGFALAGALLFALVFAPVLAAWKAERVSGEAREVLLVRWLRRKYMPALQWVLKQRKVVLAIACGVLVAAFACFPLIGGEFMPKLEEGNLWVRATLPPDASFEYASQIADEIRSDLRSFPEVTQVISQVGRPDDGTDASTFNNLEFSVSLLGTSKWPSGLSKEKLIDEMGSRLQRFPGVVFNFSQNIQDNVEEAMSGVKGENSVKLFGDDFGVLQEKANAIADIMRKVEGVEDVGVFQVGGQPNLLISIDRSAAARYGLMANDLDSAIQAAVGGIAATQILDGDRRFDMVVRYRPEFRQDPDSIRNILLPTPDGNRVPLGQLATVEMHNGAFMIYRENDRRYIPIKFSVRGRDLSSTMEEVQDRLSKQLSLPNGYRYEFAGEYDSLRKEQRRLMVIIPLSVAIIVALLYIAFNNIRDALVILITLPFAITGGIFTLLVTHTSFSISAAVGFTSATGVATLAGLVMLSSIRRHEQRSGDVIHGVRTGAHEEMRPVMMACLAAGLGLLPAALSHGIGAQAQQPLARVVVGAMVTTTLDILFLLPVLAIFFRDRSASQTVRHDQPTPEHKINVADSRVPVHQGGW